ncbi:MAG: 1-acyl-sn-glycerol-3-phosphate acyltransferase [Burkholderiales bacterium]|nr:1-acyl-sn-glycerol-3-phosphate acyltransferase [Opitutaceae bacterium]
MIERVRGVARLGALFGVIVWAAVTWLACPAERRDLAARARWLRRTCARMLRVLNVRVVAKGSPPAGGVILAANHLGYLDILVLGAATPTVFVAKSEVRGWPLFGWMAARAGTRFIDRGRTRDVARVGVEVGEAVDAGVAVAVFLEGTSTDGRTVANFKSSLLAPAVAAGWPVAPVALGYGMPEGRSADTEVCWWGEMELAPHLANLCTLPWVEARIGWGVSLPAKGDRKELAHYCRKQIIDMMGNMDLVSSGKF